MRTIFLYFRPAVERPRLLIQVSAPTAAFESAPAQAANRGPLQAEILQLCYGMIWKIIVHCNGANLSTAKFFRCFIVMWYEHRFTLAFNTIIWYQQVDSSNSSFYVYPLSCEGNAQAVTLLLDRDRFAHQVIFGSGAMGRVGMPYFGQ
jgi:hypothetical protein